MLKGARGFEDQTSDNKVQRAPYAAAKSKDGKHWVITAWEPCKRTWEHPKCPCLHSDAKIPDCKPGASQTIHGRLWFYEGTDLDAELKRLEITGWKNR
jgi:hypothetical protein